MALSYRICFCFGRGEAGWPFLLGRANPKKEGRAELPEGRAELLRRKGQSQRRKGQNREGRDNSAHHLRCQEVQNIETILNVRKINQIAGHAKPRQAKASQGKPGQARPGQAKPSQVKPSQATPSHTEPRHTSVSSLGSNQLNLVNGPLVNEHRLRLLPSKFWRQKRPLRSTVNILVVALVLDSGSEHMDWHIAVNLFDSHHVLNRINEFGEAPDLLRGVGLPWSCRTALIEAASSGVVTFVHRRRKEKKNERQKQQENGRKEQFFRKRKEKKDRRNKAHIPI